MSLPITVESPKGDTPEDDVSCADCGAYRTLIGPLTFDGVVVSNGDFVCESCAESRGFACGDEVRPESGGVGE